MSPDFPVPGPATRWRNVLALAAALVPPLLYVQLIGVTGANAHSNDYLVWIPLIDSMWSGHYAWSNYFKDTLQQGCHCYAIPILLTAAFAPLTDGSIDASLYLAVAGAVLKLVLLHDALTFRAAAWIRQLSLVALSALIFSPAHVNVFTFGFSATHIGLTELGFVLAVWGVARFPGRWAGVWLACAGALVASWSWGSGLVAWPILACAMRLLGFRRWGHFAVLAGCCAVAALPYLAYANLNLTAPQGPLPASRAWVLLEAPGWLFSRTFVHGRARIAGALALIFVAGALLWLRRGAKDQWIKATPALMFLAYGFGLIVPVAIMRAHLAAWYTTTFGFLWVGLVGLAAVIFDVRVPRFVRVGGVAFGVAGLVLFASNGGYLAKAQYLKARGPAAEACLRNFRNAPPVCEQAIFQWRGGHPEFLTALAEPLERQQWGAFAPRQRWSLQGDDVLGRVSIERPLDTPDLVWTTGLEPVKADPIDFRRLNLFLPAPGSAAWSVTLPKALRSAVLRTAVALSDAAEGRAAPATFKISIGHEDVFTRTVTPQEHGWFDVEVPIAQFAGEPITITFSSTGTEHPWAMFQFPVIDLELAPGQKHFAPQPIAAPRMPNDFVFDLNQSESWELEHLTRAAEPNRWWVQWDPTMSYLPALDLCAEDYASLLVTTATSPNCFFRNIQVFYQLQGETDFTEAHSFRVPLYGGPLRTYAASLKMLDLPRDARITRLRIDPLDGNDPSGPTWVDLAEVRLAGRSTGRTRCHKPRQ